MANPFSAVKRAAAAVFNLINHGGMRPSHEDEVSRRLKGGMSDANSEAKIGSSGGTGGSGPGLP